VKSNAFQEAPLSLPLAYKVNDCVTLITFPTGTPPYSYRLHVKITASKGFILEGRVLAARNLGDGVIANPHYVKDDVVTFEGRHIQGSAPDPENG
jgi:hypothetical protein